MLRPLAFSRCLGLLAGLFGHQRVIVYVTAPATGRLPRVLSLRSLVLACTIAGCMIGLG